MVTNAFSNGAYETKLNNVVDALENHGAMADHALRHETVFKGLANLLVDEVHRQLRQTVTTADRITHGGTVYNVLSVINPAMRNIELELMCKSSR